jgi:hypothetical protein
MHETWSMLSPFVTTVAVVGHTDELLHTEHQYDVVSAP